MIVAIDGPAGAGKSTIATRVAAQLGYQLIDTGAMYRTVAKRAMDLHLELTDASSISKLAATLHFGFEIKDGVNVVSCNGQTMGPEIRTPEVSNASSIVSAFAEVRHVLVELQREIGKTGNAVLEGRDIGTVVFPNADVKIFLTATPEARATRRVEQMRLGGEDSEFEIVLEDIVKRDKRDRTRKRSPLVMAEDGIKVDSTEHNIDDVVALILKQVELKSVYPQAKTNQKVRR